MARTLIRSRWLLTGRPDMAPIEHGAVVITDGVVSAIGPYESLAEWGPFQEQVGDPSRHIVMPGLINGHHHGTRPSRLGLKPGPLETWILKNRARPLPMLSDEESYDHTLWGALQMLKVGVTTVLDHHMADPRLLGSDIEPSIRAYLGSGIRAIFACGCVDQQPYAYTSETEFIELLPEPLKLRLQVEHRAFDPEMFFRLWEEICSMYDGKDGRMWMGFAPGGPQWCSEPLLKRISQVANEHEAPIQIHLAETRYQLQYGLKVWGCTPVAYLSRIGFLGPNVSCAHGIWTTKEDWSILADAGASVVHNPASNLLLASGISPVTDMLLAGVTVGFGLDATGFSDSMDYLPDLRLGWLLQRRPGITTQKLSAAEMLAMATSQGARAIGLEDSIGTLEPGKQADLLLVDSQRIYDDPYIHPCARVEEVLIRRGFGSDVESVMVHGEWVIWDRRYLRGNEDALERRISISMERFLDPAMEPSLADQLEPYVTAFFEEWDQEEPIRSNYLFNTR